MNENARYETATLAGGCFWCLEAAFEGVKGVKRVVSGYAGGTVPNPSYEQVCTGTTGHAEVVQITFDPADVTFENLLEIFVVIHDPTTLNRQGGDIGTQYRSAIFFHSEEQERIAREVIAALESDGVFTDPIVTEIVPLDDFYQAEDHHQGYYRNNPGQGYCSVVITPKLAKLREKFADRLA